MLLHRLLIFSDCNHGCSISTFWFSMGLHRWATYDTASRNVAYVFVNRIWMLTFSRLLECVPSLFIEKYPQIKQLMGYDWRIAVQVLATVLFQLMMAYLVQDLPWKYVWLLTYVISGTLNHSLSISFHESNLFFLKLINQRFLAMFFRRSWSQLGIWKPSSDGESYSWIYCKSSSRHSFIRYI